LPAPGRPAKLLAVLPHDRGCRLQPNSDAATLVDIGTLGGNARTTSSAVNIGAICRHLDTQVSQVMQLLVLNASRPQACSVRRVIPEIDIWRAATLMPKRYGEKALEQSSARGRARGRRRS
jgi:hypothetical protein